MTRSVLLISILSLFFTVQQCFAQEEESPFQFNGDIGSYHALRTSAPYNWMTSRNRFRLAAIYHYKQIRFFGSLKINHHGFLSSYTGVFPREYYLDYTTTHFGVRAGRQIVIRGIADGLRLNDIVSPMDMTEFLTQEYDDLRIPVNAVRFFYFSELLTIEAMFIPTFQGYKLPLEAKNPWSVLPKLALPVSIAKGGEPEFNIKNMEYGGQISFNLPGVDFSFSGIYTWNKLPCFEATLADDWRSIILQPKYSRMVVVGGDISKPINDFVLRAEGAYTFGKLHTAQLPSNPTREKDLAQGLLGVDWYGPRTWNISLQGLYEYIPNYKTDEISADEHSVITTFRISKKLFNELITLASFGYFDVMNKGVFNRFSLSYQILDGLLVNTGYDLFHGDKGIFASYKNNSEVWAEIIYKF